MVTQLSGSSYQDLLPTIILPTPTHSEPTDSCIIVPPPPTTLPYQLMFSIPIRPPHLRFDHATATSPLTDLAPGSHKPNPAQCILILHHHPPEDEHGEYGIYINPPVGGASMSGIGYS
ncbi:hypothetical protein BDQ12DRAFT_688555 [Crucibulum laeve]|uniref:Uncharacterized protein n=1 Tax=Crucibulum laeve TaxID=68775 RepID=A0A5C3LPY2_9AGAR|nr:hypothetical protein BDQ12DRAFT_688555 [Crucibulum laeve]